MTLGYLYQINISTHFESNYLTRPTYSSTGRGSLR